MEATVRAQDSTFLVSAHLDTWVSTGAMISLNNSGLAAYLNDSHNVVIRMNARIW